MSEQDKRQIRALAIKRLTALAELYPSLRLGQILANAYPSDLYHVPDDVLARELGQLQITYSQFAAARIKP